MRFVYFNNFFLYYIYVVFKLPKSLVVFGTALYCVDWLLVKFSKSKVSQGVLVGSRWYVW